MRISVVIILLFALVLTGCSNVRTYTFQKDRVDQVQKGNRGYILGTPPPAPVEVNKKRTMIGIDIEIPILPGEEGYAPGRKASVEEITIVEEDVYYQEPQVAETTNFGPKERIEEVEEDWVK